MILLPLTPLQIFSAIAFLVIGFAWIKWRNEDKKTDRKEDYHRMKSEELKKRIKKFKL